MRQHHEKTSQFCMGQSFHHARIQRGARGPDPPPPQPKKNHKKCRVLGNNGPDPMKNHKATKPAFNVGSSSAQGLEVMFLVILCLGKSTMCF